MQKEEIISEIMQLKRQRNAVIVAHNYQSDDIQAIADMVGDSLELSKYCMKCDENVILFCGVHFMAESAKIMTPEKIVLLPEIDAKCPLAEMASPDEVKKMKEAYPNADVVCYINSSASVKAESDICCTSSNAIKVVRSLENKDIIFIPDKNLGRYVSEAVPEKNIILWEGFCPVHHIVSEEDIKYIKTVHPEALILVHPECQNNITCKADFVGSTKQIIDFVRDSKNKVFIIGTEMGIIYELSKNSDDKKFYMLTSKMVCADMKKVSLLSVYKALKEMNNQIEVDEDVRVRAKNALDRMLTIT